MAKVRCWSKEINFKDLSVMLDSKCLTCKNRWIRFDYRQRLNRDNFGSNQGMRVFCQKEVVLTFVGIFRSKWKEKPSKPSHRRYKSKGFVKNCKLYREMDELITARRRAESETKIKIKKGLNLML